MLVGAGKTDGAMDAEHVGNQCLRVVNCIIVYVTTTLNINIVNILKKIALERRFQKVGVSEPDVEDTISILRGLKKRYESTMVYVYKTVHLLQQRAI